MLKKLFLITLFALAPALAQVTGGAISGRVHDPTGAAVPGASVIAIHTETGTTARTVANQDGVYAFPTLAIGTYEIAVTHTGFKKSVRRGIAVHVSDRLDVPLRLELGEVAVEVTVAETAEQVQTESADQGSLISGEQVRELQLNGRSFMTLLELIPGVASNMSDRMDPNSSPSVSINGARSTGTNFNMDGGNNSDVIVGGSSQNTFTSVESIAEFTAVTSAYSAEYGRAGFAQINVVTRSGSKDFHGALYEFFRNDKLDAHDYFTHRVLPLRLNNFGFRLGGPVPFKGLRNKTFFFFNQEFNRIKMCQSAINTTVPTAAMKQGDFSALSAAIVDPLNGSTPFAGNIIPTSRLNPMALKILSLYPEPNFVGPGTLNYSSAIASTQNFREEVARVDHNFSDFFKIYGRLIADSTYVRNPYGGSGTTGSYTSFPGLGETQSDRPGANFVFSATRMFSPTLINEAHFSYARRYFDMHAISGQADRTRLGITLPELYPENRGNIIPSIGMTGYAGINVATSGHKELYTVEFSDNVSKVAGRHMFKAGFYFMNGGNYEQKFNPNTKGSFSFDNSLAKHPVANLVLGLPSSYSEVDKTVWTDARFSSFEAFIQDDFKVTDSLTLNLGLRYVTYLAPYDRNNTLANFIPSRWKAADAPQLTSAGILVPNTGNPLNGVALAGKDSPYGNKITNDNKNLWGPRFGFAWSPFKDRKTALRGGYGIFYTRPLLGTYLDAGLSNPPFVSSVSLLNPLLGDLGVGRESAVAPTSLIMLGLPMLAPTVQQFSFGIQRELPLKAKLDVTYVHTHATHLMRPVNINAPQPGVLGATPGNKINAYRPYVGYTAISDRETSGSSLYDSLQVSFNRQVSTLTLGFAYTWGKSIDDGSTERGGGDTPPDMNNIRAERAVSDYDRTHIFTANFIWKVPNGARGAFDHAALRPVLNGWQLSGITRMWSGNPLDVTMDSDVAGIGATQNQRPSVIAGGAGSRTPDQWFNRNAFARPATGTFGNLGRNALRGPGVNKWDLAFFKNFRFAERWNMQFRGEMFNIFNHPSFSGVATTLATTSTAVDPTRSNFAVVTSTRDARVAQLALKLSF